MEFDEKSVVPVLEAKYDSFTQSEKNIADFFLKNKNQADYSIETLSQKLFVSKASISRFVKKCGFRGYRELIPVLLRCASGICGIFSWLLC